MGNIYHASDPLRNRVYDWEDGSALAKAPICSMDLMRRLVRRACRYYKVKPPTVVPLDAKYKLSFYLNKTDGTRRICFIPDHRNPVVALHEVAHHICDIRFGDGPADHCKEWFSIYMWLLIKFEVYKKPFLAASLKPYRLRLRPLGPERIPR
jgi:hypothetical protein